MQELYDKLNKIFDNTGYSMESLKRIEQEFLNYGYSEEEIKNIERDSGTITEKIERLRFSLAYFL